MSLRGLLIISTLIFIAAVAALVWFSPETLGMLQPVLLTLCVVAALAAAVLLTLIVLTKGKSMVSEDDRAASDFERAAMLESCDRESVQSCDREIVQSCNRESVQSCDRGESRVTNHESRISTLLAQLRLAKLDPKAEGDIHSGPHAGAVILRLGRDEIALVVLRPPADDEWAGLFPRYDRVFIPLGENKWVSVERLEGLVRFRMDAPL